MKKFLALGLLGISHACDPALRTDCYEDSSGEYKPAGDKVLTNLVLTLITDEDYGERGYTEDDVDSYGTTDCSNTDSGKKEWGDEQEGNVVECITAADLAPELDLNEAYDNGHVGQVVTYSRILVAPTTAMCDSLATTVCDVAGYTVALIADAGTTACGDTVCGATDVATCCVSKFAVVDESDSNQSKKDARTKLVTSLSGKSKGVRLDWSTTESPTSFTAAERREAVKLIVDGEKIKYKAGEKERTVIGRTARRDEQWAKAQGNKIKQTKGETIEFPVHTADGNDHVCVELGAVDVCFTITPDNLGQNIVGTFEASGRRLSEVTAGCFQGSQLTPDPEGGDIYSFDGAFNASNGCAITETLDSEGASQYAITEECNSGVTTDIQVSGTFSPWTTTPATTTSTTCGYCHAAQTGCTHCAEGLGLDGTACVSCGGDDKFNSIFDHTACGDCPEGSTSNVDNGSCDCNAGYYGTGVTHESNGCNECVSIEHAATVQCTIDSDQKITTCHAGYYGTPGDASCQTCDAGSITDTGTSVGATTCTPCGDGFYSLASTAGSCSTCTTIANAATVQCTTDSDEKITTCAPGYFGHPGDAYCQPCAAGSITDTGTSPGATMCTECTPGLYSLFSNVDSCLTCAAGSITNTGISAGAATCTECTAGLYSLSSNVASCQTCAAGSITDTGTSPGATMCTECTPGLYSLFSNVDSCLTCAAGSITNTGISAGAATCTECTPGLYSLSSNVESCLTCAAGSITNTGTGTGATTCTPCAQGKAASSATGTCETCLPKTFANHTNSNGDYSAEVGHYTCKSCTDEVNGYSTEPGQSVCKSCSGFSTEWINSQCCGGDLTGHCAILNGQCDTSCSVG